MLESIGQVVKSDIAVNINHGGWDAVSNYQYGSNIMVVIYQPDHVKLDEWFLKEFPEDKLKPDTII